MRSSVFAIVALTCLSTSVQAQRKGMGGSKEADWNAVMSGSSVGLKLSNGDVEDMDPVKRLVDKRKDLKLTDDQQKQLKEIDAKLRESNRPYMKTLDSLRQAMRPRAGADEDAERARVSLAREAVMGLLVTVRGNYATSLKEAMPILQADQQPKAEEILKKLAEETDETMKDKLSGGMGGMGGGGRRGGRPPN